MGGIGNLDIVISGDVSRLSRAIDQGKNHLQNLEREGAKLSAGMERHTQTMSKTMEREGAKLSTAIGRHTGNITKGFLAVGVAIGGAAAAIVGSRFIGSLNQAAESIDKIGKVARRLGVDVGGLSDIKFAAQEAGVEFDALAKLSAKAAKQISEMVSNGQSRLNLGPTIVKLTDAQGRVRSITELLPELGRGLESVGNAADQLRLAEKLFGSGGGSEFVGFLRDGGKFLGSLTDQAERNKRLGGLVTAEQVRRATELRNAVGRMQSAWQNFKVAIVTEIAPPVTAFVDGLAESIGKINRSIPLIAQAAGRILSRTSTPEEAALFAKLRESLTTFVGGAAIDVSKLIAVSFVSAVVAGFEMVTPIIADMLRDALRPILNAIPGIDIAPSAKGKLEQARADYEAALSLYRQIEDVQNNLDNNPYLDGNDRSNVIAELNGLRAQAKMRHGEGLGDVARRLEQAKAELDALELQRRKASEESFRELAATISMHAQLLSQNTAVNGAALEESIANITAFYAKLEPVTTDAGNRVAGLVNWYQSLTATTRTALQTMKQFAADVKSGDAKLPQFNVPGGIAGFNQAMQARSLRADGNDRAADRIKLEVQQAMELRKLVDQLGVRGYAHAAMAQVQVKEMAQFEMKPLQDLVERLQQVQDKSPEAIGTLMEQIRNLKQLTASGLLDDPTFEAEVERIKQLIEGLGKQSDVIGKRMYDAVEGFKNSASDAFADLVVDGKAGFAELAKSWAKTLISMATNYYIMEPLFRSFAGFVGRQFGYTPPIAAPQTGPNRLAAMGMAVNKGVQAFAAGGVVAQPTYFPMAGNRRGLMGEAGPEGILPLERIGGKLGVNARGGGVTVQVIDQRSSGAKVQTSTQQGPDGQKTIRILIRDEIKGAVADGSLDRIMGTAYGLNRRPGTR